ncbi:hypothetical protein K435DRAFT_857910 [Dendrothele bispora CBS 962.96]|uniref:C2H2-type domain-containing protein n=1 Tax=Dendrothele bispora (strain CBS 962.96) TaxID=1314807 RepID=A0A4S8M4H6_DENBC|nr:hypothetical protein K435DRAFT_857910 [Dendrothele bispora CBS 962.96]
MSTPINHDKDWQALMYALSLDGFKTRDIVGNQEPMPSSIQNGSLTGPLSLNHYGQTNFTTEVGSNVHTNDDSNANFSTNLELGSWNGTNAACTNLQAQTHGSLVSTGHLAGLEINTAPVDGMAMSAVHTVSVVLPTSGILPPLPMAPDISPITSGPSPTTPGLLSTVAIPGTFLPLDPQVLQLFLESFPFEGGDERGSGGNINQILQDHLINEDKHMSSLSVPSTINIESSQIQRPCADSAVKTQVPLKPDQVNASPGPFACKSCGREYTASHNLKYHIWSCLHVKPFRCQELEEKEEEPTPCPFRTTTPYTLKRHVKSIHKKVLGEWPQPDFSDYPDWISNNLPTLNHMALGSHTSSNNGG